MLPIRPLSCLLSRADEHVIGCLAGNFFYHFIKTFDDVMLGSGTVDTSTGCSCSVCVWVSMGVCVSVYD